MRACLEQCCLGGCVRAGGTSLAPPHMHALQQVLYAVAHSEMPPTTLSSSNTTSSTTAFAAAADDASVAHGQQLAMIALTVLCGQRNASGETLGDACANGAVGLSAFLALLSTWGGSTGTLELQSIALYRFVSRIAVPYVLSL